jgi:hypothetical protein
LLTAHLFSEGLHDAIKLLFTALLDARLGFGAPRILLFWVKAPNYYVAATAPVIVPVCVEDALAFGVRGTAEEGAEGWFELGEEDEVVWPFVLRSCG